MSDGAAGGLYLDTDIIVLRDDILLMPDAVSKQKRTGGNLNGAVFKVLKYHPFTHELMSDFVDNFDPKRCVGGPGKPDPA